MRYHDRTGEEWDDEEYGTPEAPPSILDTLRTAEAPKVCPVCGGSRRVAILDPSLSPVDAMLVDEEDALKGPSKSILLPRYIDCPERCWELE